MQLNNRNFFTTGRIATIGLLFGIVLFLDLTKLGYISIGLMNLTLMHIPVIIGAIIEGPIVGMIIGLLFGISSMINQMMTPTPTYFIFMNPVISIGVRVLLGYVSGVVFKVLKNKNMAVASVASALLGTLTNTVGVLGLTYIFYAERFAKAIGISSSAVLKALGTIVVTNGIPEAILAAFIVSAVVFAYYRANRKKIK